MLHGVGVRVPSPALKTSMASVVEVFLFLIYELLQKAIHSVFYFDDNNLWNGIAFLGNIKSIVHKFVYRLSNERRNDPRERSFWWLFIYRLCMLPYRDTIVGCFCL